MAPKALHVLVVDDSAMVRQLLATLLAEDGSITVAVAADPVIALRKMEQKRPDVIVLDLEMPRMDGMTFLRKIMREDPIPVVVCSGHAGSGTETALRALEEGAVEVLAKPKVGLREFLYEAAVTLTDAIRAASHARVRPSARPAPRLSADVVLPAKPPLSAAWAGGGQRVVAIGASTGGTDALTTVLSQLPQDAPPLIIVQHMPEGFTAAFAHRLNQVCRITVKEAAHGDAAVPGRALIAPGNRHTLLVRSGFGYAVEVRDGPLVCRHRPSVDVLFRSFAQTAGRDGLGVILTGMGNDGAAGLLEMRQAGAATCAQSEETCVVFGMPKEAIALGAAATVLPLGEISHAILAPLLHPTANHRPSPPTPLPSPSHPPGQGR
jgi:two-component system, chemotaxis family, protein-glutamate methylesterase/glutaminase